MGALMHEPRAYKKHKDYDRKQYFKPNNIDWVTNLLSKQDDVKSSKVTISNAERKRRRIKAKRSRSAARK